jgi:hypothetical protein
MIDAPRRAYHEAAHAIACVSRGVPLRAVSLSAASTAIGVMDLEEVDAVVIALCGPAAERRAFGTAQLDAIDVHEADSIIRGIGGGWRRTHFELLADRFVEDHWRLIQRLADRLLRDQSMSGAAVLKLVRENACVAPGY